MNSSQISKLFITSAVLAVATYLLVSFELASSPIYIAVIVFISCLLTGFFNAGAQADSDDAEQEVKTLYVGNLPYRANESTIRELFALHGKVHSVRLMKDKHTGKRRGFGFVEMSANDVEGAIASLNDQEFQQRTLKVREAKERPEKTDEDS